MDIHREMLRAAANAAVCRRTGAEDQAVYWTDQVERLNLLDVRQQAESDWDVLKGSPDHVRA